MGLVVVIALVVVAVLVFAINRAAAQEAHDSNEGQILNIGDARAERATEIPEEPENVNADSYDPNWRHEPPHVLAARQQRVRKYLLSLNENLAVRITAKISTPVLGPERQRRYEEAVEAAKHPGLWRIRLAGATHETRVGGVDRKSILRTLQPGQPLELRREPQNEFDQDCVSVWFQPEIGPKLDVGFLPRSWSGYFASLMDRRAVLEAVVAEVAREGPHGSYLFLYAQIRQVQEPELKHRPRRETILRAWHRAQEKNS